MWLKEHCLPHSLVAYSVDYSLLELTKMHLFSGSKMSLASVLVFIGLQVNLCIGIPIFRNAASIPYATQQERPELFQFDGIEIGQPTVFR